MPKAWPGSITISVAAPAIDSQKDGRTTSRGETTIGSRPRFHASDQSVSATASDSPTLTASPQATESAAPSSTMRSTGA